MSAILKHLILLYARYRMPRHWDSQYNRLCFLRKNQINRVKRTIEEAFPKVKTSTS